MKIYIKNQNKQAIDNEIKKIIKSCITASINKITNSISDIGSDFEVSVMLTDNKEIQSLNFLHRGMDKPTDVLSFPLLEFDEQGHIIEEYTEYNNQGDIVLGDIVIAMEKAIEQACEYEHSINREVGFLTVHSMLHLFGFDHTNEEEEKKMFALQEEILSEAGLIR